MSARVSGIGWVSGGRCGTQTGTADLEFTDPFSLRDALLERGILPQVSRRFAKFDDTCRMTTLVAALTLHDAQLTDSPEVGRNFAIVGSSEDGCLATNRAFYRDFVEHGRRRGRGSLFVYTLPSMPFAEVSLHFNLNGPSAWVGATGSSPVALLARARALLEQGTSDGVLALLAGPADGLGVLLTPEAGPAGMDLDALSDWMESNDSIPSMIQSRWPTRSGPRDA